MIPFGTHMQAWCSPGYPFDQVILAAAFGVGANHLFQDSKLPVHEILKGPLNP